MKKSKPILNILAGPNGSGKSTLADFLKNNDQIHTFLNADTIAKGLGNSARSDIDSGKILLNKLDQMLEAQESFTYETTLSGKTWIKFINKAKDQGYFVKIYFIFVESEELAIERVANRVHEGGHNIPEATIRRRFKRSINNFKTIYQNHCDKWYLFNNTSEFAKMIAKKVNDHVEILDQKQYDLFLEL